MKRKYKYCYEYYKTGIKYNVKSFINRLEKEANILTNKDIDIDNNNKDNNNSTDEIEDLNIILSKKFLSINMSASDPGGRCFFCISCNNKYNPRKCFVEFRNSALTTSIQRTRNTAIVVASSTSIFCIEF